MALSVLELTQALINRPSVTPDDGGCLPLIEACLTPYGFQAEYFHQGRVKNVLLKRGRAKPFTVFLGHVDVVPPGPLEAWTFPPFQATIHQGYLYGRGSSDMKSAVAAFVVALQRYHSSHGSIGLLLTSDEEGPSLDGIRHVMQVLTQRGEHIDYCLVGEPSSQQQLGDTIKIGRRGSLSATLTLHGQQGHVAYPHLADNPIHRSAGLIQYLAEQVWDTGHADFPATTCQITQIEAGTGANNVIPGELQLAFNFRYSPASSASYLQQHVEAKLHTLGMPYTITWHHSGLPFLCSDNPLRQATIAAVQKITGLTPHCSTDGGTSDGRFVAPTGTAVIEVGVSNKTIHQIDECVKIADLEPLSQIYLEILTQL